MNACLLSTKFVNTDHRSDTNIRMEIDHVL